MLYEYEPMDSELNGEARAVWYGAERWMASAIDRMA